ncbi:hypothetical protein PFISCL1PPCAC_879, partial [Pristionchus fissidentatus]
AMADSDEEIQWLSPTAPPAPRPVYLVPVAAAPSAPSPIVSADANIGTARTLGELVKHRAARPVKTRTPRYHAPPATSLTIEKPSPRKIAPDETIDFNDPAYLAWLESRVGCAEARAIPQPKPRVPAKRKPVRKDDEFEAACADQEKKMRREEERKAKQAIIAARSAAIVPLTGYQTDGRHSAPQLPFRRPNPCCSYPYGELTYPSVHCRPVPPAVPSASPSVQKETFIIKRPEVVVPTPPPPSPVTPIGTVATSRLSRPAASVQNATADMANIRHMAASSISPIPTSSSTLPSASRTSTSRTLASAEAGRNSSDSLKDSIDSSTSSHQSVPPETTVSPANAIMPSFSPADGSTANSSSASFEEEDKKGVFPMETPHHQTISPVDSVQKEFEYKEHLFLMENAGSSSRSMEPQPGDTDDIKHEQEQLDALWNEMHHTSAGGDGGEVDAFVDPLAPVDVHAAANDDNVEAALLAIYAKAGHQPEKRIRETLETEELRTSHPVDLADFFGSPEGNSSSIPLTAAQLEKALRKEHRNHREERKEMYRRLNLPVPPGRPHIEREAQLREQLLALDEKERLEKQEKAAAAMREIVEQGMDGGDRIDVRHLYEGVVKDED